MVGRPIARLPGRPNARPIVVSNSEAISNCLRRAVDFLGRCRRDDGGFARQAGEASDAWTTGEIVLALRGMDSWASIVDAAKNWLLRVQNVDGSWRAYAYAAISQGEGDVAATSYAVRALIWAGISPSSREISRAREWLLSAQRTDGGWAVFKRDEPFSHVGLTGYAVSALTLCPPWEHLTAEAIQRGLFCLHRMRLSDGGWSLRPGGAPDATLSCYAIRSVLDAYASRGYEPRVHDLLRFMELWQRRQTVEGAWSDWYGNKVSIEATAYVLEIVSCLYSDPTAVLLKNSVVGASAAFLVNSQNEDGGYSVAAGENSSPWVTHNVVLALRSLTRDPSVAALRAPEGFFPPITGPAIVPQAERYDVSISFEAEHRSFADVLAFRLQTRGLVVFYDTLEKGRIWGNQLPEVFESVFARSSEYCIVLISATYMSKPWPLFELRQMQTRLVFERRDSILPVIMSDDVTPPDYLRTIGYLKASEMNIEDIVELVVEKVRSIQRQ